MWVAYIVAGVVAIALAVLVFRNVRKRGAAEGQLEIVTTAGERNDKAEEILAEPIGDAGSWSDRMHRKNGSD